MQRMQRMHGYQSTMTLRRGFHLNPSCTKGEKSLYKSRTSVPSRLPMVEIPAAKRCRMDQET
jgi:hypothetical protein